MSQPESGTPQIFTESAQPQKEQIDFDREATVAVQLSKNERGKFVYPDGSNAQEFVNQFSLFKFGHLPAVRYVADRIVRSAVADPRFLSYLKNASPDQQIFMCSPGIYNTPSASNLLMREVASRLSVYLSKNRLPMIVAKDLTTLGEMVLNYAEFSVAARDQEEFRTLIPSDFSGQPVIFLDDIYISGNGITKHKKKLREAGVGNMYFLLGAQIDQATIAHSGGKIEAEINHQVVGKDIMGGVEKVFLGDYIVVQKLLRLILDPTHQSSLASEFIAQFPEDKLREIFYKIYTAAAGNDYWNRYNGKFAPSLRMIEQYLQDSNVIDEFGLSLPQHAQREHI